MSSRVQDNKVLMVHCVYIIGFFL